MIEYFLGMKFKKSIIKSMVEIKHWSIGHLNLFWKTTKFFWGIAQKNWSPTFSSQSCWPKIGDWFFSFCIDGCFKSLDQWPFLIGQFNFLGNSQFFWAYQKNQSLIMATESWWKNVFGCWVEWQGNWKFVHQILWQSSLFSVAIHNKNSLGVMKFLGVLLLMNELMHEDGH